jgi:hypothetical protein
MLWIGILIAINVIVIIFMFGLCQSSKEADILNERLLMTDRETALHVRGLRK